MNLLESRQVQCPYCGEEIDLLIDCSISQQQYIEDCSVCCRPIGIQINIDQAVDVSVRPEND